MQFFLHGQITKAAAEAALIRHSHRIVPEGASGENMPTPDGADSRREFFAHLAKNQWELITTDADLVHQFYNDKIDFNRSIILLVGSAGEDQPGAIDRLFARYPRLSPQRLYTLTSGRVKIRQLPGAGGTPAK